MSAQTRLLAGAFIAIVCGVGCTDSPTGFADSSPVPADSPLGSVDTPSAATNCDGISLGVVLGPLPVRPGTQVRVYATSSHASPVDAVTDAQGAVCLHASPAQGPWDVTFIRPGHVLVTLAGVTEASVGGSVRLDPYIDADSTASAEVVGHIEGRSMPNAIVQVGGVEFDTVRAGSVGYRTRYRVGSVAPLVMPSAHGCLRPRAQRGV